MDTSKKCCKRRCQQQALAQRQMCKQHTGQCLPHLIPVRPVRQQNSTQVLLAEQKLTETPSEYEEFYDCLSESDVQKETKSRCKHKSRTPKSPQGNFGNAKVFEHALKEIVTISEKLFEKYEDAMRQQIGDNAQRCSDDTTAVSTCNKSMSSWNSTNAALSDKCTDRSTDTAYTEKCTTDTSAKDTNCETSKILLKPIPLMIPVTVQPYIYRSDIENSERQYSRSAKGCEPIRTSIIAGSGKMNLTDTSSEHDEQLPCYPMIRNAPSQIDTCCGVTDYEPICRQAQEEPEDICTGDSSSCSCISEPSSCCCNIEILPEPVPPEPEVLSGPAPPPKPKRRPYRLAIPQHKEMNLCTKCRYDPSPLINEAGEVFCPGNCGCCLCPWKHRLTESKIQLMKHDKIKVCRCRERGTIFTDFELQPHCSQMSYYDVCPCREIAEEKCLELYDKELWNAKTKSLNEIEERRVSLSEVVEVPIAK